MGQPKDSLGIPYSVLSSYYMASRGGVREMEEQAAEKTDLGGESGSRSCFGPAGMISRC